MSKAQLCPVCGGSGVVHTPPPKESSAATWNILTCHGCGGKGWVEVSDCRDENKITITHPRVSAKQIAEAVVAGELYRSECICSGAGQGQVSWSGAVPYDPLTMPSQRWDDKVTGYCDAMNSPVVKEGLYKALKRVRRVDLAWEDVEAINAYEAGLGSEA